MYSLKDPRKCDIFCKPSWIMFKHLNFSTRKLSKVDSTLDMSINVNYAIMQVCRFIMIFNTLQISRNSIHSILQTPFGDIFKLYVLSGVKYYWE